MKNPKIISINIRTDGNPIAICRRDENGKEDYSQIGLIALPFEETIMTYQINCIGIKPFSPRAIKRLSGTKLEESIDSVIQSNRKETPFTAIRDGVPIQVYSLDDSYIGSILFGRSYDPLTRAFFERREIIPGHFLGDLKIKKYSNNFCSASDFSNLKTYLSERVNYTKHRRAA